MPFSFANPTILAIDPYYFGGPIDYSFLENNWQTLSVNQRPRYGLDYPFVDPGTDIFSLIGDLFLSYEDQDCAFVAPFRVQWMYGFGTVAVAPIGGYDPPVHDLDIIIVDANDQVVFDSTEADVSAFSQNAWGEGLETVSWWTSTAVLHLTRHTGFPQWYDGSSLSTYIEPTNGELDARSYMRVPRRVRSIRVGLNQMVGDIVLSEGFNIQMVPQEVDDTDGSRRTTQIEIRALPGDGLGRVPGCTDADTLVRRINNVEGTEGGDFKLEAQGCYWLKRPNLITVESPRTAALTSPNLDINGSIYGVDLNQLLPIGNLDTLANLRLAMENADSAVQLLNSCDPCCECDDYVRTYRALKRVYEDYLSLGRQAESTRDQHRANILRWEDQAFCRLTRPLRLVLDPGFGGKIRIGAAHCNLTECCIGEFVLRLTLESFQDGVLLSPDPDIRERCDKTRRKGTDTGYLAVDYILEGAYPIYDTTFDFADPQATSNFQALLQMQNPGENTAVRVTLSVHAGETINLDGKVCPTPSPDDIDVPPEVAALWAANPAPYPVRGLVQKTIPIKTQSSCCD